MKKGLMMRMRTKKANYWKVIKRKQKKMRPGRKKPEMNFNATEKNSACYCRTNGYR